MWLTFNLFYEILTGERVWLTNSLILNSVLFSVYHLEGTNYRLKYRNRTVMKARLVGNSANELVHGHSLKKGCAKFEIVNVYVRAAMKSDWGYDADIHLPGGFIAWPLRNARVVKTVKKATDTSVFDFIRANRFINKAIHIQCSFLENLGWVFRKQFFDAAVIIIIILYDNLHTFAGKTHYHMDGQLRTPK